MRIGHPDADALLRAILENPEDDAPRLIWADVLDDLDDGENGYSERAEFVRAQIRMFGKSDVACWTPTYKRDPWETSPLLILPRLPPTPDCLRVGDHLDLGKEVGIFRIEHIQPKPKVSVNMGEKVNEFFLRKTAPFQISIQRQTTNECPKYCSPEDLEVCEKFSKFLRVWSIKGGGFGTKWRRGFIDQIDGELPHIMLIPKEKFSDHPIVRINCRVPATIRAIGVEEKWGAYLPAMILPFTLFRLVRERYGGLWTEEEFQQCLVDWGRSKCATGPLPPLYAKVQV